MKNINKEVVVYLQLGIFACLWFAILYFTGTELKFDTEAIKKLPDVVTVYLILHFVFTQWLWKLPFLQGWLVPYPNLNGTWRGTLKTTWVDPMTNQSPAPIPVILVIKQTFSTIGCVMFTAESESYSTAGQINEDDSSDIFRLSYNYTNRPNSTIRERSQMHDGAAIVKIISNPKKCMEGEYWTSRKTTGEISVEFRSRKRLQKFVEDL